MFSKTFLHSCLVVHVSEHHRCVDIINTVSPNGLSENVFYIYSRYLPLLYGGAALRELRSLFISVGDNTVSMGRAIHISSSSGRFVPPYHSTDIPSLLPPSSSHVTFGEVFGATLLLGNDSITS